MINIKGVSKAALLKALYDSTHTQGLGLFAFESGDMSLEEAENTVALRAPNLYFDYHKGRVMKVDLGKDQLFEGLYDRDNYQGACYDAIKHLLTSHSENTI